MAGPLHGVTKSGIRVGGLDEKAKTETPGAEFFQFKTSYPTPHLDDGFDRLGGEGSLFEVPPLVNSAEHGAIAHQNAPHWPLSALVPWLIRSPDLTPAVSTTWCTLAAD
jgi:hypothetical protein